VRASWLTSWLVPCPAPRRWVRADLRAQWGQATLTGGIVAAVVAWLVLAAMLLEVANSPWQGLHDRTHGADVVVTLAPGTPHAGDLSALPGVREASRPVAAVSATLAGVATAVPAAPQVQLQAMPYTEPAMSAPLVVEGSWLSPAHPDGVVVEASLAAATRLRPGSRLTVDATGGVPAQVVGIAETADQGPYPQSTPGLIWVTPALLRRVAPKQGGIAEVVDLRLADQCAVCVTDAVNEVASAVGPANVWQAVTWQQASQQMAASGWLSGELLGLFGLIALAAAACAIANVTAARAIAQRQATATLKAIGFTPGQVAGALLGENLMLAAAGTAAGLTLAWGLSRVAPAIPRPGGVAVTLAPLPSGLTALIAGGTMLAVAVATVVQAWRSARVPPTAAVMASPPRGKLSRLARVGLLVRFPAPLVLGTRDAFTRRALASLTIAGVAIPVALVTIALASWATIGGLTAAPGRISLAAALAAYPSGETAAAAQAQVNQAIRGGEVLAAYPGAQFQAPLPGQAGTFTARAMGTAAAPYPFRIAAGRNFQEPDEAVASQRLLAELGLRVGSRTWVVINGVPVIFRIVGQVIDPAGNGDVLDFPMDAIAGTVVPGPQFYSLVLAPGATPASVTAGLRAASDGNLAVQPTPNPAAGLGLVREVIVISMLLLTIIGLANLVTATRAGLRDHLPEAGVLAAMGLTPAQVTATYVVATSILTLTGVAAGTVAGLAAAHWLINAQAASVGLGWGIESLVPAPGVLLAAMLAAVLAGTGTALLVVQRSVVARPRPPRAHRLSAPASGPVA
jgi:putative ABC transport system permease protein